MSDVERLTIVSVPHDQNYPAALYNLKFFPGDEAVSAAELRKEAQKALHLVDKGICERKSRFRDEEPPIDIDDFLSVS